MDPAQARAVAAVRAGRSLVLTGPGGSGKSHVVRACFGGRCPDVALTGMTGASAVLVGGVTLHSFLGIGRGDTLDEVLKGVRRRRSTLRKTRVIVIDECSMLSGALFGMIDEALGRECRLGPGHWGGRQLVLSGDLFQLGPVTSDRDGYFFESDRFVASNFDLVRLETAHRHPDPVFATLLARVRLGDAQAVREIAAATARELAPRDGVEVTRLFTTNAAVDAINHRRFDDLGFPPTEYVALDEGDPRLLRALDAAAPQRLALKPGSQVMVTRNVDVSAGLCNGTRGVVQQLLPDAAVLSLAAGGTAVVGRFRFEVSDDVGGGSAARTQLPLRLAWAMTVHKSQGATLDYVSVDLGGAFAPGQVYTALSRARCLDGLHVARLPAGTAWESRLVDPRVAAAVAQ